MARRLIVLEPYSHDDDDGGREERPDEEDYFAEAVGPALATFGGGASDGIFFLFGELVGAGGVY